MTWQLLEEHEYNSGSSSYEPLRSYVHAGSSGYIDHVVSMRDHVPATPKDYWYHHDDLFSPMAVTDDNGAVYERYEYDDYGVPVILASGNHYVNDARGSSSNDNPVLFTGRYYDTETGLYYYRTRYMDPKLGRFTTRDTIGVWGDAANLGNGLAYVGGSPLTWLDPFGQHTVWPPVNSPGPGYILPGLPPVPVPPLRPWHDPANRPAWRAPSRRTRRCSEPDVARYGQTRPSPFLLY